LLYGRGAFLNVGLPHNLLVCGTWILSDYRDGERNKESSYIVL